MNAAGKTLMVQGTTSSAGKSLLVTALCRYFRDAGLRVAPFKSQNMALNSAVTRDGFELGRAQAVQAEAAGVDASVDMNPILLKPEGDSRSQVVLMGRPLGSMSAVEYHEKKLELRGVIAESLNRLRARHDLVVIEGAGSPAEINLRHRDLVNMHVARIADAPVLLVGDIDRGGVFAAFVGTLELLDPEERARIAAFVVNKFRGDLGLLQPGLDFLEQRTGKPVLGVLPYLQGLRLADEDSVSLDHRGARRRGGSDTLDIAVVRLPRISNHDDFMPLEHEPGVTLRFVEHADEARGADLVIVPGSKSTAADLAFLRHSGLADVVSERARRRQPVLGICGGCQMLGGAIEDPDQVEPGGSVHGLGLLPIATCFGRAKTTAQVQARPASPSFLTQGLDGAVPLRGYEIHMGHVDRAPGAVAAFAVQTRHGAPEPDLDGAVGADGSVVGTMLHGLFDNDALRAALLAELRRRRGLPAGPSPEPFSPEATYDRLASAVGEHLDLDALWRMVGLPRPARETESSGG